MVAELYRILLLLNRFRGKSLVSKKRLLPWKKDGAHQVIKLVYLRKECYRQGKDLCTYLHVSSSSWIIPSPASRNSSKNENGFRSELRKRYYMEPRKHDHRKNSEILPDALCSEIMLAERNEWNPDCSTVNNKGHKESNYLTQAI